MKNFCVIHILLFLLLMLVYKCAGAQDYVVTTKGDTITGEVKPLNYGPEKKVQVTTPDREKNIYSIFQTKAYTFKGKTYKPVRHATGYIFMQLLKPGYLSLYAFQQENQVLYDGLYLLKRDGSGMEVPNLTFKKHMTKYLEDCPAVAKKIENGDLNKRSVGQIVDAYNNCIEQRTAGHEEITVQRKEQIKKISAWDVLEEKVKAKPDFEGKTDALDMITEIKSKIRENEKIPNFLIEGLKNSLPGASLAEELQNALSELKN